MEQPDEQKQQQHAALHISPEKPAPTAGIDDAANNDATACKMHERESMAVDDESAGAPAVGPVQTHKVTTSPETRATWAGCALAMMVAVMCGWLSSRTGPQFTPCITAEQFQPLIDFDADTVWQAWKDQVVTVNPPPKPAVWVLTCQSEKQCTRVITDVARLSSCNLIVKGSTPSSQKDELLDDIIKHAQHCPTGSVLVMSPEALEPEIIASVFIPATGEKGALGRHGGAATVSTARLLWLYIHRTDVPPDFPLLVDFLEAVKGEFYRAVLHRGKENGWSPDDAQHVAGSFTRRMNLALPLK